MATAADHAIQDTRVGPLQEYAVQCISAREFGSGNPSGAAVGWALASALAASAQLRPRARVTLQGIDWRQPGEVYTSAVGHRPLDNMFIEHCTVHALMASSVAADLLFFHGTTSVNMLHRELERHGHTAAKFLIADVGGLQDEDADPASTHIVDDFVARDPAQWLAPVRRDNLIVLQRSSL
jgi:hypothetical protein